MNNIIPIKMVIEPSHCILCGRAGDVWSYGLQVSEIMWKGVVCDICAMRGNRNSDDDFQAEKVYRGHDKPKEENDSYHKFLTYEPPVRRRKTLEEILEESKTGTTKTTENPFEYPYPQILADGPEI